MKKTKVAVCMKDIEYQRRFVNCWMNHYQHHYELYVFTELKEMMCMEEEMAEVILIEGYSAEEIDGIAKKNKDILILMEEKRIVMKEERPIYIDKYLEVYKIEQMIREVSQKKYVSEKSTNGQDENMRLVGVFSVDCEGYQLPFSGLAAMEYGESERTLLINLQAFSGLEITEAEEMLPLTMEDVLTIAEMEMYNESRILGAIGHEQNWDYLYPVKNTECLVEANIERYQKVLQIVGRALGYKVVILNFGVIFEGFFELLEQCDEWYLLVDQTEEISCREQSFQEELKRRGKDNVLQRVKRVEISKEFYGSSMKWRRLVQQWRWSFIGDSLRESMWRNGNYGRIE